jgi:putative sterol carrier protein
MNDIEHIRTELAQKVSAIPSIGKRLKFKLDEHVVVIDGTGSANAILGDDIDADCTIAMSIETYLKIQRGEIKPMMATLTGRIKVRGDIGLAQKLKQLM